MWPDEQITGQRYARARILVNPSPHHHQRHVAVSAFSPFHFRHVLVERQSPSERNFDVFDVTNEPLSAECAVLNNHNGIDRRIHRRDRLSALAVPHHASELREHVPELIVAEFSDVRSD